MTGPLCFVLMPFGRKPDPAGGDAIDFDRTYELAIRPGVAAAGMTPLRADEEKLGGIIHAAMFERLLVCDFAVADLTTSNPNVLYELGVRHAARPRTTLTVYASSSPLPFDVRMLRTQPYSLDADNALTPAAAEQLQTAVTAHLRELAALAHAGEAGDSPLFQLVPGWKPEPLPPDAAESFRAQVAAAEQVKERLVRVRAASKDAGSRPAAAAELAAVRAQTVAAGTTDAGVLTELMLAHRALEDWSGMIEVHAAMPVALRRQAEVRQRVAFAYNRRAERSGDPLDRAEALRILEELEQERGPSAETSGLLGRIYKDQWSQAVAEGDPGADGLLLKAVRAYVRGFETDWRETYPGVNAVTLLDVQGTARSLQQRDALLPVVRFAAQRRLRSPRADFWDHATALEVAVLADDEEEALERLDDVVASSAESWQPATTARNLRLLGQARRDRGEPVEWLDPVLEALDAAAGRAPDAPPPPRPAGA